jgi:hypothetical protein
LPDRRELGVRGNGIVIVTQHAAAVALTGAASPVTSTASRPKHLGPARAKCARFRRSGWLGEPIGHESIPTSVGASRQRSPIALLFRKRNRNRSIDGSIP